LNSAVKLGCGFGIVFSFFKTGLSTFYHSTIPGEDRSSALEKEKHKAYVREKEEDLS
jgi:hypothetical protein